MKVSNVFLQINKIQTHLITVGNPFDCDGIDVLICITGNPGISNFYNEFIVKLSEGTGLPACVIGQAGHEEVPDKKSNEFKGQTNLFNLEGQIKHKLDLITNYIDKRSKLHIIGHSVGSWLLLELLHRNEHLIERLASVNMLFPTIQRMALSDNGKHLNNYMRKLHVFIILFISIIYYLPESVCLLIISIYLKIKSIPAYHKHNIVKFLNPMIVEKVLYMAYEEMDNIVTLNTDILEKIKHVTMVLYSSSDRWAPLHYMEDLRQFQPQMQMKEVDIDHTFVLNSSERVADLLAPFIKTKIVRIN